MLVQLVPHPFGVWTMASNIPEPPNGSKKAHPEIDVSVIANRPGDSRPQVVNVSVQTVQPSNLVRTYQFRASLFRKIAKVARVFLSYGASFHRAQILVCEFPQSFKHSEPNFVAGGLRDDQRPFSKMLQTV